MYSHNMILEPGFCTALNKCILVCPDDASIPKHFTVFLTPPVNDDDEEGENANFLKMTIQEKLDNKNLKLLTKMDVTIPMRTSELRDHVKKFRGCDSRLLSHKSLVHKILSSIFDHIEDKEIN